jgi:hypothetical protein
LAIVVVVVLVVVAVIVAVAIVVPAAAVIKCFVIVFLASFSLILSIVSHLRDEIFSDYCTLGDVMLQCLWRSVIYSCILYAFIPVYVYLYTILFTTLYDNCFTAVDSPV